MVINHPHPPKLILCYNNPNANTIGVANTMSFTNFAKTIMLTTLLTQTARASDGKHKVVVANNGTINANAPAQYVTLKVYGHNPPVITNAEPIQWTSTGAWGVINEVYVVNDSIGQEIILKGQGVNYSLSNGAVFLIPTNAWEASLVE